MAAPIAWAALAVLGIYGVGWASREAGEAAGQGTKLVKWGVVAGGMYVSYRALQSAGAIK